MIKGMIGHLSVGKLRVPCGELWVTPDQALTLVSLLALGFVDASFACWLLQLKCLGSALGPFQ